MSPTDLKNILPLELPGENKISPLLLHAPELLAPAGGIEQFFAAIHAGADAVYLGLKDFNARRRAQNFDVQELGTLVAYAAQHGVKVLVTLNVLIKEAEFARITPLLEEIMSAGVYALIVQDLGLAYFIKTFFPAIRMHASTQLAVHNYEGVVKAYELGFSRVVLARELTILEISKIKKKLLAEHIPVELEVFCHGSLCYSYSGLCFFSGSEGGRSGNRGECAYTCRKPYKILSEPGHGFLFSMKDLSTTANILDLVKAGVDTLKIEGRKKDAQYVMSAVRIYRQKIAEVSPPKAPICEAEEVCAPPKSAIGEAEGILAKRNIQKDLMLSFSREFTSLFVNNRYHENVIDLNNPTHLGMKIGAVEKITGEKIACTLLDDVEVYDGIRIEPQAKNFHALPQHGSQSLTPETLTRSQEKYAGNALEFSLRDMWHENKKIFRAQKGQTVFIAITSASRQAKIGDTVYKTRSVELKQIAEKLSKPQGDRVKKVAAHVHLRFIVAQAKDQLSVHILGMRQQEQFFQSEEFWPLIKSEQSSLKEILTKEFSYHGTTEMSCTVEVEGKTDFFIPPSQLKKIKRTLAQNLREALDQFGQARQARIESVYKERKQKSFEKKIAATGKLALKTDQIAHLKSMLQEPDFFSQSKIAELVFEPKRSQFKISDTHLVINTLKTIAHDLGIPIRIALPMVFRVWDKPFLLHFVQKSLDIGVNLFETANIGGFELLKQVSKEHNNWGISTDFSLYALNSYTFQQFAELGVTRATFSVEDDAKNIMDILSAWPRAAGIESQLIVFKDIPLFVAESCSLTALHNGCPGSTVCGYRSLEIEDEAGARYTVAHEACRSVVYSKEPFSLAGHRHLDVPDQFDWYRFDFLTRQYSWNQVKDIIHGALEHKLMPSSHTANVYKELL